jgi:hypothetical protein
VRKRHDPTRVRGTGDTESSRLSWVGCLAAALAWISVLTALGFDRPHAECGIAASSLQARNMFLLGAVLFAVGAIGLGGVDWMRRHSRAASNQPSIATVLLGIGTVLGVPALFLAGHLTLWLSC